MPLLLANLLGVPVHDLSVNINDFFFQFEIFRQFSLSSHENIRRLVRAIHVPSCALLLNLPIFSSLSDVLKQVFSSSEPSSFPKDLTLSTVKLRMYAG